MDGNWRVVDGSGERHHLRVVMDAPGSVRWSDPPGGAAIGASTQCPDGLDEAGGRGGFEFVGCRCASAPCCALTRGTYGGSNLGERQSESEGGKTREPQTKMRGVVRVDVVAAC